MTSVTIGNKNNPADLNMASGRRNRCKRRRRETRAGVQTEDTIKFSREFSDLARDGTSTRRLIGIEKVKKLYSCWNILNPTLKR